MIDLLGEYVSLAELEAGLDEIRRAPRDAGVLELIVRRPRTNEREVLDECLLDLAAGLVGDCWGATCGAVNGTLPADRDNQINIMNARAIALIAGGKDRWPLAGDQLYVDLDLSQDNLPAGTRLAVGSAVIEITAPPHTGCHKFKARFGGDALKFVNSRVGRALNLRGRNAKIVQPGTLRVGDAVRRV